MRVDQMFRSVNHTTRTDRARRTAASRGAWGSLATVALAVAIASPSGAVQAHSVSRAHVVHHHSVRIIRQASILIPKWTTVVAFTKALPGYSAPGGKITRLVEPTWLNSPLITPVLVQQGDWVKVRLPMRPNETTTWVKADSLIFSKSDYFIIVNTKTTHVHLYKGGVQIANVAAGTGSDINPTPIGFYFVTMFAASDGNGYGPWEMMTSAHSDTITNWSGTGDALISMHGPLFSDAIIGNTGAHISHGCIRLHSADQLKFQNIPEGTPIVITNA